QPAVTLGLDKRFSAPTTRDDGQGNLSSSVSITTDGPGEDQASPSPAASEAALNTPSHNTAPGKENAWHRRFNDLNYTIDAKQSFYNDIANPVSGAPLENRLVAAGSSLALELFQGGANVVQHTPDFILAGASKIPQWLNTPVTPQGLWQGANSFVNGRFNEFGQAVGTLGQAGTQLLRGNLGEAAEGFAQGWPAAIGAGLDFKDLGQLANGTGFKLASTPETAPSLQPPTDTPAARNSTPGGAPDDLAHTNLAPQQWSKQDLQDFLKGVESGALEVSPHDLLTQNGMTPSFVPAKGLDVGDYQLSMSLDNTPFAANSLRRADGSIDFVLANKEFRGPGSDTDPTPAGRVKIGQGYPSNLTFREVLQIADIQTEVVRPPDSRAFIDGINDPDFQRKVDEQLQSSPSEISLNLWLHELHPYIGYKFDAKGEFSIVTEYLDQLNLQLRDPAVDKTQINL
ncbi:MAG: hypothetical protein ACRC2U_18165, partial [Aeromonas sp.]